MSNVGSSGPEFDSANFAGNPGTSASNETDRGGRATGNVDMTTRSGFVPTNSESMQNPAGTGHDAADTMVRYPHGGYGTAPSQGLTMHNTHAPDGSHGMPMRSDGDQPGMGSLLPTNAPMFDPSTGSGAPLLSAQPGGNTVPNQVLRPAPLSAFSMGLSGGHGAMGNLTMQGPLLSNGTNANAKNMQAHNLTSTESFVAMQPQGMMHTQTGQLLPSASGAGNPSMSASPHTLNLSQPQNIPLNTFLTSSHALSSGPPQGNAPQQGLPPASLHLQQPGHLQQQGQPHGNQQGPPMMMHVDPSMQPAQQGWMMRQQQQQQQMQQQQQQMQQQGNMMPGGGQMAPQPHMHNPGQPVQSQPPQYHMQQSSMPGQPMYGQPQQGMQQGMPHMQQHAPPQGHMPQHMNVIPPQQQQMPLQHQQQGQPNQSQGGSFAGNKLQPKPWHSADHVGTRNGMVEEIIKLLKTRRPNATDDWHEKLPHMARRLEDALYHEANDLNEYSDNNSLKQRLQQLALSMGGNKQAPSSQPKPGQGAPPQQMQNQQQLRPQPQYPPQMQQQKPYQPGGPAQMQGGQQFNAQQPQYQQLARTAQAAASQYPQQAGNPPQQGYLSSSALEYNQQQLNSQMQGQGGMHQMQGQQMMHPNMQYGSNPVMMGGNAPQQQVVNQVPSYMMNPNDPNSGGNMGTMNYAPMQGGMQQRPHVISNGMPHQGQMMHPQGQNGQMQQSMPSQHSSGQGHSDEHRKQVLKQQQQRLLLLRHASKCPHDNGRCPVTPHCWSMKQLWKHIMGCKDQECKMAHCVSSRYVLSHYSKCKEPSCPVCGPVREAIKRNVERSKDVTKSVRASSGGVGGYGGMPMHNAPQRDEPPAKRQKKGGKDTAKVDERVPPTLVIPSRPRAPPKSVYPLDPISCAIYCFSAENIQAHFRSIHEGMKLTVAKIREMCKPLIEELFRVPHAHGIFGAPVDPVMLGLNDYFDVIKMPMDLGTVMKKLGDGSYRDLHNFVRDVHLTFDNAMTYNPKNSDVFILAKSLKKDFDTRYKLKVAEFERNIAIMRDNPDACLICGEPSLKFEPPVYYCNGTCAQRIRRNAVFFSNNTNTYHWCNPCFNQLRENETVRLPDCTVTKAELLRNKKKHTEESEEGWVQCEGGCQRWVHQVCALFNARRNTSDEVSYVCPLCIQKERTANPEKLIVQPTTKKMSAADLPLTIMSQFLEKRIYKRLEHAYVETAQKLGVSVNDVEKCPPLILRQVSCQDKMHTVREGVYNRYKEKGYPTDFPCRTKCVVLFQNIDGQDVILFGMYVYEYGHKCAQPNQRRVYISYLDSVHYLRPKQYRTLVYHEILISYLDYVRARGFHTAHIWACPPQKGDDYILYVHPPDQKTPKPQILRLWYDEMLKRCVERGIVCEYTDFHTEYLVDHNNDATVLPYFEGDYWVNEAEVIIKNLKTGVKDDDEDDGGPGKSKRKSKAKRMARPEVKPMALGKSERDPVMAKLASIIEPMKDTFFVARLHPKEYAKRCADNLTAETAAGTGETSVQQEEKLREEALTGSDVQMPAGAEAPAAKPAEEKGDGAQSGEEGKEDGGGSGNDGDDQEDEDNDFAKAAMSVSMTEENAGGEGEPKPPMTSSMSVMQFSDFTALKRAESFTSQGNLQEMNDGNESVTTERMDDTPAEGGSAEAGESGSAATPSARTPRGSGRLKGRNDTNKGEEAEAANEMDTAGEGSKSGAADEGDAATVQVKDEPFTSVAGASPIPSKGSGFNKVNTSASSGELAASASEETKIKAEEEDPQGEGESGAVVARPKVNATPPPLIMAGEDMPELKDDTEDVDDVQENEHFETRQSFLNLCQGNHYQFDQLRRAKHTSMMVLYHLHNPDAPKFVPSCNLCHADILTGYRHHCDTCEIDFCGNCWQAYSNSGQRLHQHALRPMAVSSTAPQQLTEEQRRERARSVQLHMQLLQHAANCIKCESKNCLRMKEFLKHDGVCTVKAQGGCRLCARITNLLNIHARACRVENCKVPHCLELREQMRKLTLRQQQMDDRRRQNMNNEYGRGGGNSGDTGGDEG